MSNVIFGIIQILEGNIMKAKPRQISEDESKEIEKARIIWSKIAKRNGWYVEPFYIQVWIGVNGKIKDSVAFQEMDKDIIIFEK